MLVFARELIHRLIAHAQREAPKEACGILAGVSTKDKFVEQVYECKNIAFSNARYEISPEELLRVITEIEESGLEVLGFYHSHPMALSEPSAVDEATATWPGHSYVVVSLPSKIPVTSWIWDEKEGFIEEKVEIR
ncbi:MAG: M67 family metallopeptidase [Candidatus Hydrothermarchaeales archaeon]